MVTMLRITSECSVTANILVLGTSDSGFESQHSDTQKKRPFRSFFLCVGVRKQTALFPSGIRMPERYTNDSEYREARSGRKELAPQFVAGQATMRS